MSIAYIDIFSKDGRSFRIGFTSFEVDRILVVLNTYATIDRKEYFFAYDYFKFEKALEEKYNGWKLYDVFKEFTRQGIDAEPIKDVTPSDSSKPDSQVKTMSNHFFFNFVSIDSNTWTIGEGKSVQHTLRSLLYQQR